MDQIQEKGRDTDRELFWEDLVSRRGNGGDRIATVVAGEGAGTKCVLNGRETIWQSSEGFPKEMLETVLEQPERWGLLEVPGGAVFVERVFREKRLVVCGGGHVAQAVIRGGKRLGFTVTAIEDRLSFADEAGKAGADQVICDTFTAGLNRIAGQERTGTCAGGERYLSGDAPFYVIATRGHRFDLDCLRTILRLPFSYLGMMGSRGRVAGIRKQLLEEGFEPELLEKLHAPIGLAIGAETPEEIGISILAEIIQIKNKEKRWGGYDRELLSSIKSHREQGIEAVLATIIARSGSAPREVGTKMLIGQAGGLTGTIGGGCMEARVIREARGLMENDRERCRNITVDMTSEEAGQDGMVCGGRIRVFLEKMARQI